DGVHELWQHEADQPAAAAAQLGGPLVAQHVQGGEHRVPRALGHPRLAVEHATDRRLAHAHLLRHIRKPSRHGSILATNNASRLRDLHSHANGLRPVAGCPTWSGRGHEATATFCSSVASCSSTRPRTWVPAATCSVSSMSPCSCTRCTRSPLSYGTTRSTCTPGRGSSAAIRARSSAIPSPECAETTAV